MSDTFNIETVRDTFNWNVAALTTDGTVERAAQGFQDALTTVERAKQDLRASVESVARANGQLKEQLRDQSGSSETLRTQLTITQTDVAALRDQVEKERTLNALRKEQAESLQKKTDGNYYTSWMGLNRPLREESRTGLLVAAIAFLLLAIAGLGFGFWHGLFTWPTSASGSRTWNLSNVKNTITF